MTSGSSRFPKRRHRHRLFGPRGNCASRRWPKITPLSPVAAVCSPGQRFLTLVWASGHRQYELSPNPSQGSTGVPAWPAAAA